MFDHGPNCGHYDHRECTCGLQERVDAYNALRIEDVRKIMKLVSKGWETKYPPPEGVEVRVVQGRTGCDTHGSHCTQLHVIGDCDAKYARLRAQEKAPQGWAHSEMYSRKMKGGTTYMRVRSYHFIEPVGYHRG